jgi:hypothetical protein
MRRRLRDRKRYFAVANRAGIAAATDISSTIRRLLEAREKSRTIIEQLKRRAAGADLDWMEAVANEIAATGSIESVMSKYKELKLSAGGAEEKIAASLVVLGSIDKLLAHYKKYHRDVVIHHLKTTASLLAQSREAHKRDRARLAARLENLLLEIRELEPDALSGARLSKS